MTTDIQSGGSIDVRVTRTLVQRFQLGQTLVPICLGANILARRFPETVNPLFVLGFFVVVASILLSAMKRFGKRRMLAHAGMLDLGDGVLVQRDDVTYWACDGELARLYGSTESYALRARVEDAAALKEQLTRAFGPGRALQPRGSLLARRVAIALAGAGLLVAASVVFFKQNILIFVGVAWALLSLAAYAALRQRVLRL